MEIHVHVNAVGEATEESRIVRIVHVSDTHMAHDDLISSIPSGDIFIHSGDFVNYDLTHGIERDVFKITKFFDKLPHKHKIFVAGNHEMSFYRNYDRPEYIDSLLENGIYLQDQAVTLEGVKIYGSPWNTSYGMAFHSEDLKSVWARIPADTDILVTHSPPFGMRDLGFKKYWSMGEDGVCQHCTERSIAKKEVYHGDYAHQGCPHLRHAILNTVRPKAHLFGHVHNHNGTSWEDGVLFSNASIPCEKRPSVIDFHMPKGSGRTTQQNSAKVRNSLYKLMCVKKQDN